MRLLPICAFLSASLSVFGQSSTPGNYTYTTVAGPNAAGVFPTGLNASGQVVGYYNDSSLTTTHGILITNQKYTTIDVPGSVATNLLNIDDNGNIYGVYTTSAGNQQTFSYKNGVFTDLPFPLTGAAFVSVNAMSPSGMAVGFSLTA